MTVLGSSVPDPASAGSLRAARGSSGTLREAREPPVTPHAERSGARPRRRCREAGFRMTHRPGGRPSGRVLDALPMLG